MGLGSGLGSHLLRNDLMFLPSGPVLMTVGPWKPVSLHTYKTRIADLEIRSKVSETLDISLTTEFTLSETTTAFASIVLKSWNGQKILEERDIMIRAGHTRREFHFTSGVIDLWYPVGYGKQPIYTVEIHVADPVVTFGLYLLMVLLISTSRMAINLTRGHRNVHIGVLEWFKRN